VTDATPPPGPLASPTQRAALRGALVYVNVTLTALRRASDLVRPAPSFADATADASTHLLAALAEVCVASGANLEEFVAQAADSLRTAIPNLARYHSPQTESAGGRGPLPPARMILDPTTDSAPTQAREGDVDADG